MCVVVPAISPPVLSERFNFLQELIQSAIIARQTPGPAVN